MTVDWHAKLTTLEQGIREADAETSDHLLHHAWMLIKGALDHHGYDKDRESAGRGVRKTVALLCETIILREDGLVPDGHVDSCRDEAIKAVERFRELLSGEAVLH